jgi:allantoinase
MFDLLVTNARVIRPGTEPETADVAVTGGKFVRIAPGIDPALADSVVDAGNRLLFPGAIDVHQPGGIYHPLAEDAVTESKASAQGGVTTGLTYLRTGAYYLNRSGPYREVLPEALAATEGRAHIDYGFHVAPILKEHIDEIPAIIEDFGIPSFKIFMFYGKHGLHGRSSSQDQFLMLPEGESYDYAHAVRGLRDDGQGHRHLRTRQPGPRRRRGDRRTPWAVRAAARAPADRLVRT